MKPKPLGLLKRTSRGFEFIEFKDCYDFTCSLQASSLAIYQMPGTSAVWLGTDADRMHLTRDQVKSLIKHLQQWTRTGSFKYEKPKRYKT